MSAIYVEILDVKGSAPRDVGTAMKVTACSSLGTIGGGALEHRAIATAREMLKDRSAGRRETIPLGPGLGQCCGGAVTLLFTRAVRPLDQTSAVAPCLRQPGLARRPLWVWGAGHVGRAILRHAVPTGAFDIVCVDTSRERFVAPALAGVTQLPVRDMPRVMPYASRDTMHLILTYSHDIDLALCAAALEHGFSFCGLIGSDTKWARFRKRLHALGRDPAAITCPIGDPSMGKHPDQIAGGTIPMLLTHSPRATAGRKEHA